MALEPTLIKPRDLPAAADVFPTDAIMVDSGVTVAKGTPAQIVNAGRPISTQAQALAGTDNATSMTPLRVRQALEASGASGPFRTVATFSDLASVSPSDVLVGGMVEVFQTGAVYTRVATDGDLNYTGTGGVRLDLVGPWVSSNLGGAVNFAAAIRRRAATLVSRGDLLQVASGEAIRVPCNPTSDDLAAFFRYMTLGHSVQTGGSLSLEITEGLHNVTTVLDADNGSKFSIVGATAAQVLDIASVVYSVVSGDIRAARITVTGGALPAWLNTGCVVGVQNPVGDGTPDAVAQGLVVTTRHSSTSITCNFSVFGVTTLVSMLSPTSGTSMGIAQNKLVVPRSQIRANSAGWTPGGVGFQEGFINARGGSFIDISDVGLIYNGVNDGHEMLFTQGAGSFIGINGGSVVAGDCSILTRSAYGGKIEARSAFLGCGTSGGDVWQGVDDATFSSVRSMIGGGTGDGVSATAGCRAFLTQSVQTCCARAGRTTYSDSSISYANVRIRHSGAGVQPTKGGISLDSNCSIEYCTTPIVVTGANTGTVEGTPTMANNTNAPPTANAIQATGGVWLNGSARPFDPTFYKVGAAAASLDFPSIAAGAYAELTISVPGAAFGHVVLTPTRATSTMPAQNIMYTGYVSAADTVTVRCHNLNLTGTIDPTAATIRVAVVSVA